MLVLNKSMQELLPLDGKLPCQVKHRLDIIKKHDDSYPLFAQSDNLRTHSFYTLFKRLYVCFLCLGDLKIREHCCQQNIKVVVRRLVIGCRESVEQRPILLQSGEALEKKIEGARLPGA